MMNKLLLVKPKDRIPVDKAILEDLKRWREALAKNIFRNNPQLFHSEDPEKDADFLREISPINHVDKIKAPLLVIQGANDPRVPKSEADQIVEAIRKRNGIVEYLLFSDEGHGLAKLENRITAYTAIADFLDKYLVD